MSSSNTMNWFSRLWLWFTVSGESLGEGIRLHNRQNKPLLYEYEPRVVARWLNAADIKKRLLDAGLVERYGFTKIHMTPYTIGLEGALSYREDTLIQLLKSGGARLMIPHYAEDKMNWNFFALALGDILRTPKER